MGQCSSQFVAETVQVATSDAALNLKADVSRPNQCSVPRESVKSEGTEVSISVLDRSALTTALNGSGNTYDSQVQKERNEDNEDEDSTCLEKIMPSSLRAHAHEQSGGVYYGDESFGSATISHLEDWNGELDDILSDNESECSFASICGDELFEENITQVQAVSDNHDSCRLGYRLPSTCSSTGIRGEYFKACRRCSHAMDGPLSSWSDLNFSIHPDCVASLSEHQRNTQQRRGSSVSSASWGALTLHTSTASEVLNYKNIYGPAALRRGSATHNPSVSSEHDDWGALTLHTSTASEVLNYKNLYGPSALILRRGSATHHPCGSCKLDDTKQPNTAAARNNQNNKAPRRYSMAPSIDTVSEGEDRDDTTSFAGEYDTDLMMSLNSIDPRNLYGLYS